VTYTLGAKSFQTLINGYTGEVSGDRPVSWIKVFFYIILPLLIVAAIFILAQSR
jgi:hypothetical protein